MDANDSERLARLEREMAILRLEFARLRERVGMAPIGGKRAESEIPPPAPSTAPPIPEPAMPEEPAALPPLSPPRPRRSTEDVIGKYWTVAVATIAVLTGVGFFLSWAIQHGLLGPTMRVILGYATAAALGAGGARVRARGTREFGNVLLAIALGVVHLTSWAAGPLLHVMPSTAALAASFLASVTLAEFALRHDEEMLCAIGYGGAILAPFLTSDRSGNVVALGVYGVIVTLLSISSLGDRKWRNAAGVSLAGIALYTLAMIAMSPPHDSWLTIHGRLGVLFPLAIIAGSLPLSGSRHRLTFIRFTAAVMVVLSLLRLDHGPDLWAVALVVLATVISIGALHVLQSGTIQREDEGSAAAAAVDRHALIDAAVLPLGLFVAALIATPGANSWQSSAVGAIWAVLALVMTERTRGAPTTEKFAVTATVAALWIAPAALFERELGLVLGTTAMGVVLAAVTLSVPRRAFPIGAIVSLVLAFLWAMVALEHRTPYAYAPFATWPSIVTIIVIAGWLAGLRMARSTAFLPEAKASSRSTMRNAMIVGASATAFFWGRAELANAWSETASTALLIVYYAAAGALMIWLGRARRVRALRLIGLALALLAAAKAFIEAFQIQNVAVKVTTFFVVAAFLIAVGYWYRDAGSEPERSVPGPAI